MKDNIILTISSLVTIVLTIFHITSDIALGIDKPGLGLLFIVAPIVVVLLYGTLVLAGRRSGYLIILVGSIFGLIVAYLHLSSPHIGEHAVSSGGYFFIWTLLAMAATSLFSVILSARGLWSFRQSRRAGES
jgi:hypothetical protein